ncbi:hypothetical protein [Stutzerimonas nosocomialis]|uniref:hypothetical protein n=1 Tax=Stutzerimonas nosocomialis TaxID=1056496 RepID=UPI001F4F7079|nr:hypothetical protein [Stutzerimonas nosocomialis]
MRRGLTSQLSKLLLIPLFCVCVPTVSAQNQGSLGSDEPARYLAQIKGLYLTENERDALLAHSNDLLNTYALRAAYQVGQPDPHDLNYQLSVGGPGELRIREEIRHQNGTVAVNNRTLSVYGVDPYLHYQCPAQGLVCVVGSPADGSPMLTLLRDPKGAEELAKALSFLIRNLQKG